MYMYEKLFKGEKDMNEDILKIANESILWIICSITVIITLIQAALYIKLSIKTATKLNIPKETCKKAFKTGLITSIGPSIAVFIVMVGMMAVIGGPISWLRLSIIGSAPTELTAAKVGAEAMGVTFGGPDYTAETLVVSWLTMTLNGVGWLLFVCFFAHKLEKIRVKVGGTNPKSLAVFGGAAMLGVYGYLNSGDVVKGGGNLVAVIAGATAMMLMVKLSEKIPKIKEYNLGIAMLTGMVMAVILS